MEWLVGSPPCRSMECLWSAHVQTHISMENKFGVNQEVVPQSSSISVMFHNEYNL